MYTYLPASRLILINLFLFVFRLSLGQNAGYSSPPYPEDSTIKPGFDKSGLTRPVYVIETINQELHDLNKYVQIGKETNVSLNPQEVLNPKLNARFHSLVDDSINCTNCVYWCKINIKNNTGYNLENWILFLGLAGQIDVYIFDAKDSSISKVRTGRAVPADQKSIKTGNRRERIPLSFSENEILQLCIRIQNTSGYPPRPNFMLCSEDYTKSVKYNLQQLLDGLFLGFLFSLIVFNLIFFSTTQDKAFLYQLIFVASVLIFMTEIMDLICEFPILRNHPAWYEPINFTSVVLLNISYLYFVNHFIQVRKRFPAWIGTITKLVWTNLVFGSIVIGIYLITLNERISDTAIAMVSAVQYIFLLVFLFQLIRIRDKKSYFILTATLFLIVGVLVNGISVALGWGVQTGLSKLVVIGNLSFFFFGLAYRMKLLQQEEYESIRLKENQELKNKLYTNITHEFRTPITVIQGMAHQIESMVKTQESSKLYQSLQLIKSNGNRLLQLVNTILDLAKLESGKMKLNFSVGDIISYFRYLVKSFEPFAATKKVYLQFLTGLDELVMGFDNEKIQQIVSNLLSNAIKFTPPGGKIFFIVDKTVNNGEPYLHFEVKDNGEGMAQTDLGSLFNRFYQAPSSKHKNQGSGLGLALVNELVKLMAGRIEVISELGKGTMFKIILPIQAASPTAIEPQIDMERDEAESDEPLITNDTREPNDLVKGSPRPAIPDDNEKPLLLIVDDNQDIIYYLQSLLEKKYIIETARNGVDGILLAQEIIPDVIISDLLMPDKNGYELCDQLKNDLRTSHIPIILLTAKSDISSRIEGLKTGADAYLTKPFNENELLAQLENSLSLRKKLQTRYKLPEPRNNEEDASTPMEDAFLVKLNHIIAEQMENEDFGILQLCRSMQMSRTQLHRKITALTGKSTSIYIRSLRLQKAKSFLRKPDKNISEIAFAVGFSDPNYFTRLFTEEFGVTPTGFRAGS